MVGIFLTVWVRSKLMVMSGIRDRCLNSDFMEIVKKTRFPRVQGVKDDKSPQTIREHDRIIWLGDLNYRIALSYRSAKALVKMQNWRALLEKDQL
ncbi:endonuclease/exonuclease/phosphatase [Artemisia annua]|uniref:Endonuclease/exonuclease/phosphatase n=1 Tax=Artemisia annua TaxID=35608 RepID=A0A2U1P9Z2_ARTAN|nr:endonuclease/exonuclease/phosphatase [Artemisia annua]